MYYALGAPIRLMKGRSKQLEGAATMLRVSCSFERPFEADDANQYAQRQVSNDIGRCSDPLIKGYDEVIDRDS